MDLKAQFEQFQHFDLYKRVDENHVLDLYIGINEVGKKTLFLLAGNEPSAVASSQMIIVEVGLRKDEKWGLSFILANDKYEDIYLHFCADIIESSRSLHYKHQGAEFVCARYQKWREMLAAAKNRTLSASEIKGLIGEIFFLKNYLIPLYGEEKAVYSWIGPEAADQDFVLLDKWYEVKTTVSGAETVNISSVEQLDSSGIGELVVIYMDKTSLSDEKKITLNDIYESTLDDIKEERIKYKFKTILLNHGYYPKPEYDSFHYRYNGIRRFLVDSTFPSIKRKNLPNSIAEVKYTLTLSTIINYESV